VDPNADLLGVVPAGTTGQPSAVDAVTDALARQDAAAETERKLVKKLLEEYKAARDFDKEARVGYVRDRSYANGSAEKRWASSANLIASFIDVLVSFLYSKNPDVGARPAAKVVAPKPLAAPTLPGMPPLGAALAPQVPAVPGGGGVSIAPPANAGGVLPLPGLAPPVPGMPAAPPEQSQEQSDSTALAETLELVISRLWKDARLKKTGKKLVRSALTVGVGWFKGLMFSESKKDSQIEKSIHDLKAKLDHIQALQTKIAENADPSCDYETQQAELEQAMAGAQKKLMKIVRQGMTIDFVRAEDMQVSLDVADTEDYLDAGWNSNDLYITKDTLRERFTRLTEDDEKKATTYYQRKPAGDSQASEPADKSGEGQFTKSHQGSMMGGDKPVAFVKVVELWDKRDGMVKTMVDGVDRWAVEPYPPPQASTRFYPYFRVAFYETDGSRHPQSLAERLYKLQDEYSAARSSGRLTRERSVPGNIVNSGQVSPADLRKITDSVHMENIPITLTNPEFPLQNAIIAKPVPKVDPGLFDTTSISRDMEVISGVQEAQQGSVQVEKTAREASIEQSGFSARTNANRDCLEDLLTELAQYTAETGIQEITPEFAARIAGAAAFWPHGMDVQDLLTLVEVDIQGGTTGKPNAENERSAWATILPMLQKLMMTIRQIQATDPALADALINLLRETLRRMDDRLDIDLFIPQGPAPMPMLPPSAPPPGIGEPNPGQGSAMPLPPAESMTA